MSRLIRKPNIADPDAIYQRFVNLQAHEDHDIVARRNARLVLLLANHIGDPQAIAEAIDLAASGDAEER